MGQPSQIFTGEPVGLYQEKFGIVQEFLHCFDDTKTD